MPISCIISIFLVCSELKNNVLLQFLYIPVSCIGQTCNIGVNFLFYCEVGATFS